MLKKYKKFIILFSVFCFLFSVFSVNICWAQESAMDAIPGCRERGDCELDDFVRLFVFYYDKFLGLVGSLALLMFIYGGVMFLISAGNAEKVTQAKQIIIGAVIGLVIVFTSYMIIQFVMDALGIEQAAKGKWSVPNWFK